MTTIRLRILLNDGRLGPGKVDLMEQINHLGSIASAGRALGMSYRRAWALVEETNLLFELPLIEKQHGGKAGGGARLTPLGHTVVKHYRELEQATLAATHTHLAALQAEIDATLAQET